jgi:hypothetical protein
MEDWRTRPEQSQRNLPCSIYRVKPGPGVRGVITSSNLVGANTHYWHGRSTICTTDTCEACSSGQRPRWYGYVGLWSPTSKATTILELTAATIESIEEYYNTHGTLRAAQISLQRATKKPNSKLVARLEESNFSTSAIPAEIPIRKILCRMWQAFDDGTLKIVQDQKEAV